MSITQGLTKAILYIQDMDRQVSFYRDVLDLKVKHPAGLTSYHTEPWVEFETGECCLVLHVSRNKQLCQDRPKLAFSVSNVGLAHTLLTQRGAKLSPIQPRLDGFKVADGVDPEGNPFSICGQT